MEDVLKLLLKSIDNNAMGTSSTTWLYCAILNETGKDWMKGIERITPKTILGDMLWVNIFSPESEWLQWRLDRLEHLYD